MFDSLGWPELVVLLLLGLFVFGPERLPGMAAEAGRALRRFRTYARGVRDDLADDLGPEFRQVNLRSLQDPRRLLVKHVLSDDADTQQPHAPGARAAQTDGTARRADLPQQSSRAERMPDH